MTIDGIPIDISEWKCKTVSGVKVNDDAAYPGWYSTDDVYRDWPEAVVSRSRLTLKVLVTAIDALGHFETG